jgi:hypothetical protein
MIGERGGMKASVGRDLFVLTVARRWRRIEHVQLFREAILQLANQDT